MGLIAQFISLGIVAQMLGPAQFSIYVLVFSSSSIAGQCIDFGFTRYLFRMAHRGMPAIAMVRWNFLFRLFLIFVLIVPVTICAFTAKLPLFAFMLGVLSNFFYQISFLNRYILIMKNRITLSIFIESTPPMLFFIILGYCFFRSVNLSLSAVMISYCVASLMAFFLSIALADTLKSWFGGVTSLFRQQFRHVVRGIRILAVRSSGVGIEIVLSVSLLNIPIIIPRYLGIVDSGELAIFQRLIGLAVVLLAVSITSNLKHYYSEAAENVFVLTPALVSGASAGVITWLGLESLSLFAELYPSITQVTIFVLLLRLHNHIFISAAALMLLSVYLHISQAALGGNRQIARCISTGSGLVALILLTVGLRQTTLSQFDTVFGSFALAEFIATTVLLYLIASSGACLRIFGHDWSFAHRMRPNIRPRITARNGENY